MKIVIITNKNIGYDFSKDPPTYSFETSINIESNVFMQFFIRVFIVYTLMSRYKYKYSGSAYR